MRTLTLPITVGFYDFDPAQIANNGSYIRWLEQGRGAWLAQSPWPLVRCVAEGIAPVLTRTEIDYLRPLRLGEPVQLVLWGERSGASVWELGFVFEHPEEDCIYARAHQEGCFVRLPAGRPIRMPADLQAWMKEFGEQGRVE
ncbi:MAG TPA: thioesterase family protein [bacterium]|nr:thioesterase family protein [bacterium]